MAEDIRTMHEEDEDEVKYCERKSIIIFGLSMDVYKSIDHTKHADDRSGSVKDGRK